MGYKHKDDVEWQRFENAKRLRLEAELVKQRLLNEVLAQHEIEFESALHSGGLVKVGEISTDFTRLWKDAARKQLGIGDGTD